MRLLAYPLPAATTGFDIFTNVDDMDTIKYVG